MPLLGEGGDLKVESAIMPLVSSMYQESTGRFGVCSFVWICIYYAADLATRLYYVGVLCTKTAEDAVSRYPPNFGITRSAIFIPPSFLPPSPPLSVAKTYEVWIFSLQLGTNISRSPEAHVHFGHLVHRLLAYQ